MLNAGSLMLLYVSMFGVVDCVYNALPKLLVRGSHAEIGVQIGNAMRSMIHDRISKSSELEDLSSYFIGNATGKAIYDDFVASHESKYPQYVDELQGIAKGANVPISTLWLLNLREEFGYFLPHSRPPKVMHVH